MMSDLVMYGMAAAWAAVAFYLVTISSRQDKLAREIASVRSMLDGDRAEGGR